MAYLGELISIGVAFSWTATALLSEFGSKRLGNLTLNVLRMALALLFSLVLFWVVMGSPLPPIGSMEACGWMLLSGLVGYVIGDFCLFQCYIIISSRYGQLFMTLAPLSAALMAWVTLGQHMTMMSIVAMLVTLTGIGISVIGRGEHHKVSLKLPANGVLFAVGAAVCQGVGLVLSKIGMNHYQTTDMPEVATATTIFGPFVGVGFSLMAVQYTDAGIASTLMAMTPVIILLPSYWLFGQKITWRSVLGALISVVGVSLFFLFD